MSDVKTRKKALPQLIAFTLCESVITDAHTGMYSIINIFDTIFHSRFPAQHRPMRIFMALSNGHGKVEGRVQMMDLSDARIIASVPVALNFEDTLRPLRFHFDFSVEIPRPGRYAIELFLEGEMLASRILTASSPYFAVGS